MNQGRGFEARANCGAVARRFAGGGLSFFKPAYFAAVDARKLVRKSRKSKVEGRKLGGGQQESAAVYSSRRQEETAAGHSGRKQADSTRCAREIEMQARRLRSQ